MLERLYIKDMKKELPYPDRRTLKKWCKNNGVGIFTDKGSNRLYVLKAEFEIAKNNKEIMQYLKDKYGESGLSEILNGSKNLYKVCTRTIMLKEDIKINTMQNQSTYIPVGDYEKNFLNHLQNF
jgi:hypothetical protein